MRIQLFVTLVLCAACATTNIDARTLQPIDVAKTRSAWNPVISPDGQRIAYLVVTPRNPFKDKDGSAWSELHREVHPAVDSRRVVGTVRVRPLAPARNAAAKSHLLLWREAPIHGMPPLRPPIALPVVVAIRDRDVAVAFFPAPAASEVRAGDVQLEILSARLGPVLRPGIAKRPRPVQRAGRARGERQRRGLAR